MNLNAFIYGECFILLIFSGEKLIVEEETMSFNIIIKSVLFLLLYFFISETVYSQTQTFIREYTYRASETDSKLTSRANAVNEAKRLLLEEIGMYIESWVKYDKEEREYVIDEFFRQEIQTVTAGITETEVLEELWDGYTYFVKAAITIDTDDVLKRINQAIEAKINHEEIERLRSLISEQKAETSQLHNQLVDLQGQLRRERESKEKTEEELQKLQRELQSLQAERERLTAEQRRAQSEVEKIRKEIQSATQRARSNIIMGMTTQEVRRVAGSPRSSVNHFGGTANFYNYGDVWVMFEDGIVRSVFSSNIWRGAYSSWDSYRRANILK